MRRIVSLTLVTLFIAIGSQTASAGTVIGPLPSSGWDKWEVGAGTVDVVDLSGVGGDLETNQPAPTGAVRMTTGSDTGDRAEFYRTFAEGDLNAKTVLENLAAGYSYYKADQGAAAPAPSFKLGILNTSGSGDSYGQLIYEPYYNQGGGIANPPVDSWQAVSIDSSTGAGTQASGGWWWTGGFGIASSAGGPPVYSAAEWASLLTIADGIDFTGASIVGIAVGLGTYNVNQLAYVDAVEFQGESWEFEAAGVVPEPASFAAWAVGCLGIVGIGRRRRARD